MKVNIGPYTDSDQEISVKIHPYDTWSMDYTLARIILPMLIQLKATKHGSPNVDPEEVPDELKPSEKEIYNYQCNGVTDPKFHKRWNWVLDQMIYSFESKLADDDVWMRFNLQEDIEKEQERISNGFKLFGKYYESLWD